VSIVVFLGPTLPAERARKELDAHYLPPVTQGDVYRAARSNPEAIAIIDGEFDQVPAVWHKEILWAMSRGIHVYGASSMGALRAAELCTLGMEGVGAIFESYRDGALHDDDEVAVTHLAADANYRPTSEAMVNIRATLLAAEHEGIVGRELRARLECIAKEMYFPERSYEAIVRRARAQHASAADELAAFAEWWPQGCVDQKRNDALALLRVVRERHAGHIAPKQVDYVFQHTIYWQHLVENAGVGEPLGGHDVLPPQLVLDELWLDSACEASHHQALLRHALLDVRHADAPVAAADVQQVEEEFRNNNALADEQTLARWLSQNHLHPQDFARLMRDEAMLRRRRPRAADYRQRLLEHLRLSGIYPRLAERAREKQATLAAHGLAGRGEGSEELEAEALLGWYVAHPQDDPRNAALLELARANWRDFMRALIQDHYYRHVRERL
jgi:hypothetical protein